MSSLYEKSQGTKIQITSAPATPETVGSATYLDLQCTIKEVQFTGGQKQDIDVTTLCSTEQENINGLGAQSEISLSGNFYSNPAQDALREAYDNDTTYGFKIIFPSGIGFQFLAEVRQHTWSSGTNSVVSATFSLRLKGKPTKIDNALRLTTDLPDTKSVTSGSALSLTVVAAEEPHLIPTYGRRAVAQLVGRRLQRSTSQTLPQVMPVIMYVRLLTPPRLPEKLPHQPAQ